MQRSGGMFQYDSFESRGRVLEVQAPERIRCLSYLPAAQQPQWDYHSELSSVRAELRDLPPLVDPMDTLALRRLLSRVEVGSAFLPHVGSSGQPHRAGCHSAYPDGRPARKAT